MKAKMKTTSNWQGSLTTASIVMSEIAMRWGESEAFKYHPGKNCFTYRGWKQRGYQVQKGEKAIKSITFIEDEETEEIYPKNVYLFYKKQVKKIKKHVK
jgi:hypothetical protein